MNLPDFAPETEVVTAPWAGDGVFSYGQTYHPVIKAPDGRLAVDVWVNGTTTMARLWRRRDHPNLGKLPWNAPRKVKALYRADGQLAHLRAGDIQSDPAWAAMLAWEEYCEVSHEL